MRSDICSTVYKKVQLGMPRGVLHQTSDRMESAFSCDPGCEKASCYNPYAKTQLNLSDMQLTCANIGGLHT